MRRNVDEEEGGHGQGQDNEDEEEDEEEEEEEEEGQWVEDVGALPVEDPGITMIGSSSVEIGQSLDCRRDSLFHVTCPNSRLTVVDHRRRALVAAFQQDAT